MRERMKADRLSNEGVMVVFIKNVKMKDDVDAAE